MCIALDTLWLAYFGHCPEAKLVHSVESTDLNSTRLIANLHAHHKQNPALLSAHHDSELNISHFYAICQLQYCNSYSCQSIVSDSCHGSWLVKLILLFEEMFTMSFSIMSSFHQMIWSLKLCVFQKSIEPCLESTKKLPQTPNHSKNLSCEILGQKAKSNY